MTVRLGGRPACAKAAVRAELDPAVCDLPEREWK